MAAIPPLIVMFPLAALEMAASEMPRKLDAVRFVHPGVITEPYPSRGVAPSAYKNTSLFVSGSYIELE